jgi:hypothetical protein
MEPIVVDLIHPPRFRLYDEGHNLKDASHVTPWAESKLRAISLEVTRAGALLVGERSHFFPTFAAAPLHSRASPARVNKR